MELNHEFGQLRISARISHGELSKKSGVSRQRFSYAECAYLALTEEEIPAVQPAIRSIVERQMVKFRGVLQAV